MRFTDVSDKQPENMSAAFVTPFVLSPDRSALVSLFKPEKRLKQSAGLATYSHLALLTSAV